LGQKRQEVRERKTENKWEQNEIENEKDGGRDWDLGVSEAEF
jgi:hypothetical protein